MDLDLNLFSDTLAHSLSLLDCPWSLLVLLTGIRDELQTSFTTLPCLGLSMRPCYPHLSLPIQLRSCRTVPWLRRHCSCWGHCQGTTCHPHGAAPFLLLPKSDCTCTATWQDLLSEPPIKTRGIFTLLAPATSGSNCSNSSEIPWSVCHLKQVWGTHHPGPWKRSELQWNYYWKQGVRRTV